MTAPSGTTTKAKKAAAPKVKKEKVVRVPKFSLTAADAKEILGRLKSGTTRLGEERKRLKLTSNTPLRKALTSHVASKKDYRNIIVTGLAAMKAAKSEAKAVSKKPAAAKKAKAAPKAETAPAIEA